MRFNCGPSPEERLEEERAERQAHVDYITKWHKLFVLWPRRIGAGRGQCVWLEYVWRRVHTYGKDCEALWVAHGFEMDYDSMIGAVDYRLIEDVPPNVT